MSEEEYNNRIGKINAEISTDRVDADRGHYLLLQKLYLKDRYIEDLQQKVEQLENIINEAIEYVLKNKLYRFKYDDEELFEITTDKKAKDDLLNILNKGE